MKRRSWCPAVQAYTEGDFAMAPLLVSGIDNQPALAFHGSGLAREEVCLLHRQWAGGDQCLDFFHQKLVAALGEGRPLPVVRFADGEYAFYRKSLECNGLYQQAGSVAEIEQTLPFHREALLRLGRQGLLAPLVHQGNSLPAPHPLLRLLGRRRGDDSACRFLAFLAETGLALTRENYLPFYVVYAYLSSARFARLLDGRRLCLVTSDIDQDACCRWFARFQSRPSISFVPIPEAYLATRWPAARQAVLDLVPAETELCLVGAGIGALLVCVDLAEARGVPVIDAGHVLNMMNGRVDKSNGGRLYTLWRE